MSFYLIANFVTIRHPKVNYLPKLYIYTCGRPPSLVTLSALRTLNSIERLNMTRRTQRPQKSKGKGKAHAPPPRAPTVTPDGSPEFPPEEEGRLDYGDRRIIEPQRSAPHAIHSRISQHGPSRHRPTNKAAQKPTKSPAKKHKIDNPTHAVNFTPGPTVRGHNKDALEPPNHGPFAPGFSSGPETPELPPSPSSISNSTQNGAENPNEPPLKRHRCSRRLDTLPRFSQKIIRDLHDTLRRECLTRDPFLQGSSRFEELWNEQQDRARSYVQMHGGPRPMGAQERYHMREIYRVPRTQFARAARDNVPKMFGLNQCNSPEAVSRLAHALLDRNRYLFHPDYRRVSPSELPLDSQLKAPVGHTRAPRPMARSAGDHRAVLPHLFSHCAWVRHQTG